MKNNPARNAISTKMQELLDQVGISQTNYPLDNCAEFNIINDAINDGVDPRNLRIYTINKATGSYKASCINCQNFYGEIVNFVDWWRENLMNDIVKLLKESGWEEGRKVNIAEINKVLWFGGTFSIIDK